jgi:hypothetical protein
MAKAAKSKVVIPAGFIIAVDDVGWWCGEDQRYKNGPSRSGLNNRRHCLADYQSIIELGKSLNMRIKCGFVIGEWDRENILASVPNSNKYGSAWDNASRLDPQIDAVRDLINSSGDYLELAIHGLVHMFWDDQGQMQYAEFYQRQPAGGPSVMTPPDLVRRHLDAYLTIYQQNGFTAPLESFIPPCFIYTFSRQKDQLSTILAEYGIRYVSTPFASMGYTGETKPQSAAVENGIITVDRTTDLIPWDVVDATPPEPIKKSYFGMHWLNFLNPDAKRNPATIQAWIKYFARYKGQFEILVARDNAMAANQALYKRFTRMLVQEDSLFLDFLDVDQQGATAQGSDLFINVRRDWQLLPGGGCTVQPDAVYDGFTSYKVTRLEPWAKELHLTITGRGR